MCPGREAARFFRGFSEDDERTGPPSPCGAHSAAEATPGNWNLVSTRDYVRFLKYNICRCICMPSRNIAVQKAVYDALAREKRAGESFTSLFRRLLEQRQGLEEILGSWGPHGTRNDLSALHDSRHVPVRSR
jgi:predicted CopG family antitoxin